MGWLSHSFRTGGKHYWLKEEVRKFLREFRDGEHANAKGSGSVKGHPLLETYHNLLESVALKSKDIERSGALHVASTGRC